MFLGRRGPFLVVQLYDVSIGVYTPYKKIEKYCNVVHFEYIFAKSWSNKIFYVPF